MGLGTSIEFVKGVGPKLKKPLNRLGILTVRDALFFFPRVYDDRRVLPKLSTLAHQDIVTVVGYIESVHEKQVKQKLSVLECVLSDSSGRAKAIWFNQPFLKKVLKPYMMMVVKGRVERSLYDPFPVLHVLETEVIKNPKDLSESVGKIVPVYPLTQGIYQYQMRGIFKEVLAKFITYVTEPLPATLRDTLNLMPIREAVGAIHQPTTSEGYKKARNRIVFDEFLVYQLRLCKKQLLRTNKETTTALQVDGELLRKHMSLLPYQLTGAQKKVLAEIFSDVKQERPMNRLLQGDVGSGKTDVAVIAMLCGIQTAKSAAIMAPTEVLAEQHFIKIKRYVEPLGIDVVLIKGGMRKKQREEALSRIQNDRPCIAVGTHALLEAPVDLSNFGVVIVDEQHRFGVLQRHTIVKKGDTPHRLFMTATPIPRTFMLTTFGDLDKSIIDELPPGRHPIQTFFVKNNRLALVYDHCFAALQRGEQVYMVFPLIEESEKLDLESAIKGFEEVKLEFPTYKVGLMHGKLSAEEKRRVMSDFKDNQLQILVSTTVIEVGVDVPNATLMVIRDAERFGISQLHQLRGRVGRGKAQSYCFLVGEPKSESGKQRIKALVSTTDGFELAEYDLKIRGPGDMLGTKQSGLPDFNLADLVKDEPVLLLARKVAQELLRTDPELKNYGELAKRMNETSVLELGETLN